MSEKNELLPCPFCKSTNVKLVDLAGYECSCHDCGASGPFVKDGVAPTPTKEAIAKLWNTRAAAPSQEVEPVGEVLHTKDGVDTYYKTTPPHGAKLYLSPITAEQAAADMKRRCIEVCKSLITSKGPRDEWTRTQDQAFQIAVDELESLPTSDTAMEEIRKKAARYDYLRDVDCFILDQYDCRQWDDVIDAAIEKYQTEPKVTGSEN